MNEIIKIKKALNKLGLTPNLKGYHYVAEGVKLLKEDFEKNGKYRPFMEVYGSVADVYGVKPNNVERNIRHAMLVSKQNNTEFFTMLFGN